MAGPLKDLIRAYNQRRRARRVANRPPAQTPLGFQFVGPRFMQDGVYEAGLGEHIANLIGFSDRFVNVGANAGYYCAIAQTKRVPTLAFEPNPENFALLARNMQLNGWGERITALPLAAGEVSGFLRLYGEGTGASLVPGWANNPKSGGAIVPVARLDTLVAPPASGETLLILLDVEGHELAALTGARGLIEAETKPLWMVEVSSTANMPSGTKTNPNYTATLHLFRDAGYSVVSTIGRIAELTWDEALGGMGDKGYENFVFCAPSDVARIISAGPTV